MSYADRARRLQFYQEYNRLVLYGLTEDEYQELCRYQEGRCAICDTNRKLVVDHDHVTNKVRGLLCRYCNTSLGWYERYKESLGGYLANDVSVD